MVLGPFKHPDLSKVCIPGSYLCTGQASKLVIKVDASEHLELVGAALLHLRDLHLVGLDHRQQALREDPPGRGRGSLLPTLCCCFVHAAPSHLLLRVYYASARHEASRRARATLGPGLRRRSPSASPPLPCAWMAQRAARFEAILAHPLSGALRRLPGVNRVLHGNAIACRAESQHAQILEGGTHTIQQG